MLDQIAQMLDPVLFAKEVLDFEPDEYQKRVLRSTSKRLILNCCRQWGKSTIVAVKALHRAIFYPKSLILLLSPSLRQSGELFRKVLEFLTMVDYCPDLKEASKLYMTLENRSRIISLPSKEGTVRGYSGVDMLIIDEASQVFDELYLSVRPMLSVSEGSIILISTPRGKRGFFYRTWKDGGPEWEKIKVTADQCPRISREFLEEERRTIPERWFSQEYYCEFVENEGSVFSHDLIMSAITDEVEPLKFPTDDRPHVSIYSKEFIESLISDDVEPLIIDDD